MSATRLGSVAVRWLGHASVVLDLGGVRLLTDPLLQRHAGLLRRRGAAPEVAAWQGAAAVLISHLHYDHAEIGSLELLDHVPVLSAPANVRWLHARGFDAAIGVTKGIAIVPELRAMAFSSPGPGVFLIRPGAGVRWSF